MAITTFTAAQVLTAAQMNAVQSNDFNQTVSTKTASYTLVAADKGTRIVMNVASANTVTVNTSLFSAGDTLVIQNIGAGVTTVTAGTATVSSAGPLAIPQYGSGTLYFTSAGVAIYFPSAVTATATTPTFAIFTEEQASATNGGTFTSGSYVKRPLNTTRTNDITGCSIASSVITLTAGTYLFSSVASATNVNGHQSRLQDTTNSTSYYGTNGYSNSNNDTDSLVSALVTITGSTNFELQHRCETTAASTGFGLANNFGNINVYAQITIEKIA
jgi:hypothetical protein